MHIITDERCLAYKTSRHPERPERVRAARARLRQCAELNCVWLTPPVVDDSVLLRAHTQQHLDRLAHAQPFDTETPCPPQIALYARLAAGGALLAMRLARQGETAFSLMRPPGHHATRDRAMGYCYLNHAAIAVLEAQATGVGRVAVFDFDVHHGNGTESILLPQPGCAYFSVHQHLAYSNTGGSSFDNSHNYPCAPDTPRQEYRRVLTQALEDLKQFQPDLVAVSAGFDAYRGDPLADQQLEQEDFHWLGQSVRQLSVPSFSVLEGGYSAELPELVEAYLLGLEGY